MKPVFFFSYSTADETGGYLKEFHDRLVAMMISVGPVVGAPRLLPNQISFVTWTGAPTGDNFPVKICEDIANCGCFVAMMSPTYFDPGRYCLAELHSFLERLKIVEPNGSTTGLVPIIWMAPDWVKGKLRSESFSQISDVAYAEFGERGIRALAVDKSLLAKYEEVLEQLALDIWKAAWNGNGVRLAPAQPESISGTFGCHRPPQPQAMETISNDAKVADEEIARLVQGAFSSQILEVDAETVVQVFEDLCGNPPPPGRSSIHSVIQILASRTEGLRLLGSFLERLALESPPSWQLRAQARAAHRLLSDQGLLRVLPSTPAKRAGEPRPRYRIMIVVEHKITDRSPRIFAFLGEKLEPFPGAPEGREIVADCLEEAFDRLLTDVVVWMHQEHRPQRRLQLEVMLPLALLATEQIEDYRVRVGAAQEPVGKIHPMVLRSFDRIAGKDYFLGHPQLFWRQKCEELRNRTDDLLEPRWISLGEFDEDPAHSLKIVPSDVALGSETTARPETIRDRFLERIVALGVPIAIWPRRPLNARSADIRSQFQVRSFRELPERIWNLRNSSREGEWPLAILLEDEPQRYPTRFVRGSLSLPTG